MLTPVVLKFCDKKQTEMKFAIFVIFAVVGVVACISPYQILHLQVLVSALCCESVQSYDI